ncbi:MAG: hypothetical protein ACJ0OB_04335 [Flavobacteriaceae bacterium]
MFRHFTPSEFNSEIEKEIKRSSHLIQILSDEFGFLRSGMNLIESLNNQISVEFIIVSPNENKSMKLVNLAKNLIDNNATVYFIKSNDIYKSKDFFGIFDKSYLITKQKPNISYTNEELFRDRHSLFESISIESNKLNLLSGNIGISFKADKTVVNKNENFKISWSVKNSHEITINNGIGLVEKEGSLIRSIENDTKFDLTAKNKDFKIKKSIYVKIYVEDDISISVNVYDNILKKFIEITPLSEFSDHYAVFKNQKIFLKWDINTDGKFSETNLGDLSLKGNHEFILSEHKEFIFTYLTINNKKVKKIILHGFDDKKDFNRFNLEQVSEQNFFYRIVKKLNRLINNK